MIRPNRPVRNLMVFGLAGAALSAAACGGSPNAPTPNSGTATPVTVVWAADLPVLGSNVYSLNLVQASTVSLTLASLTTGPFALPLTARVGLALGTLDDAGVCTHTNEAVAAPALTAHITVATFAGSRCVELTDPGSLSGPVSFGVRIVYTPVAGKPATTTPAPGANTLTSNVPLLASVSQTIPASQAGTVTVNLTSLQPAAAVIGVGLGIPRADGGGCLLNTAINATTGSAPITAVVDQGNYCARVFDVSLLSAPASFTLTTTYP